MHSHRVDPKKYMQSLQADIPLIDHFPTSGQTSIQYPPFNLRKISKVHFILEFAVNGFSENDISIKQFRSSLKIMGKKSEWDISADYIYQEFAPLSFERHFDVAKGFYVDDCTLNQGVLLLSLLRDETCSKKSEYIFCAHPKLLDSVESKLDSNAQLENK